MTTNKAGEEVRSRAVRKPADGRFSPEPALSKSVSCRLSNKKTPARMHGLIGTILECSSGHSTFGLLPSRGFPVE